MKFSFALLICTLTHHLYSQNERLIDKVQYGFTLKAKLELDFKKNDEPLINFRVSSSMGIASRWIINELYPSINSELQLYNGGLGTHKDSLNCNKTTFEAIIAFTLTAGRLNSKYLDNSILARNVSLRYFSDFAIPSLQNPYNYSISLGTNLVFYSDLNKSFQKVGFLNINHSRFQLSYYNDGMPFQYFLLGDDYDRYHTGGGILSYDGDIGGINELKSYHFELSYHKFSGYSKNSFELANSINSSNVDYRDSNQIKYNKSLWKLNIQSFNANNGIGIALSSYNSVPFDGQHLIHWIIDNAFHIVPYKSYNCIEPSIFMISNNFKN
ncbi:hypothetical protein [Flavobacterium filum]|uniref:hypothetical protein n=1 Tax=Flavobacterium filum TaxID=370974 RepID=UPI0004087196|nr:hypothetical protein [Flavobacterium filum]